MYISLVRQEYIDAIDDEVENKPNKQAQEKVTIPEHDDSKIEEVKEEEE